jgi:hypothetical protein
MSRAAAGELSRVSIAKGNLMPSMNAFFEEQAMPTIRCPVFLAWDALTGPKMLVRFLRNEGAGDHCALMACSVFHQRMFDWLDGVLTGSPPKAGRSVQ